MKFALGGVVTRPAGSDSYPPPPGTVVTWRAHRIIHDAHDQALAAGVAIKGVIGGDFYHLSRHGGHTPWEPEKPLGVVHAIDLDGPGLGEFLIGICRSPEDTMFIQFFNWRGRQYDSAGNDIGPNDDWHLHFHVRAGREDVAFNFVERYANRTAEEDMAWLDEPLHPSTGATPARAILAELFLSRSPRGYGQATLVELRMLINEFRALAARELTDDEAQRIRSEALEAAIASRHVEILHELSEIPLGDPDAAAARIAAVLGPELESVLSRLTLTVAPVRVQQAPRADQ